MSPVTNLDPNSPKLESGPRTYLVLEGGGAKGLLHIAAAHVLAKKGHQLEGVAGTSAGAVIASLLAAGYHPSELINYDVREDWSIHIKSHLLQTLGLPGIAKPLDLLEPAHWASLNQFRKIAKSQNKVWGTIKAFKFSFIGLLLALTLCAWLIQLVSSGVQQLRPFFGSVPGTPEGAPPGDPLAAMSLAILATLLGLLCLVSTIAAVGIRIWLLLRRIAGGLASLQRFETSLNEAIRQKLLHFCAIQLDSTEKREATESANRDRLQELRTELKNGPIGAGNSHFVTFDQLREIAYIIHTLREEKSPRDFAAPLSILRIVATNVSTNQLQVFSAEETGEVAIATAVAASAAIPIVFRPVAIRQRRHPKAEYYYDGGLVANMPVWLFEPERRAYPKSQVVAIEVPSRRPISSNQGTSTATRAAAPSAFSLFANAAYSAVFASQTSSLLLGSENFFIQIENGLEVTGFDVRAEDLEPEFKDALEQTERQLNTEYGRILWRLSEVCFPNALSVFEGMGKFRLHVALPRELYTRTPILAVVLNRSWNKHFAKGENLAYRAFEKKCIVVGSNLSNADDRVASWKEAEWCSVFPLFPIGKDESKWGSPIGVIALEGSGGFPGAIRWKDPDSKRKLNVLCFYLNCLVRYTAPAMGRPMGSHWMTGARQSPGLDAIQLRIAEDILKRDVGIGWYFSADYDLRRIPLVKDGTRWTNADYEKWKNWAEEILEAEMGIDIVPEVRGDH